VYQQLTSDRALSPQAHEILDDRNVADPENSSVETEPFAAGVQNGDDLQH